jgi:altronate dehydratase
MTEKVSFLEIARLPMPGDNVAIALRNLEPGTIIDYNGAEIVLDFTVLEGHRFAIKTISAGDPLLSWELPFGEATQQIKPGNYVVNDKVLEELRVRALNIHLPKEPNFADNLKPFKLNETEFKPAPAPTRYPNERTFLGYRRSPERGVGTRNFIVILGTTSRTGSYVKQLSDKLQQRTKSYANIDGVVPAAHTEGGIDDPNNQELVLRTLAGWLVNPNVGAVLVVDDGAGTINNETLKQYINKHGYPIHQVLHHFHTLDRASFQDQIVVGERIIEEWLPLVAQMKRTPESLSHLKIGLQCGGSDAFSGISANPLLGWISEELVRHGGAANLAETDELIGAEPYVLNHVRDLATAHKFLELIERFRIRTAWHGANAEGNPSGGNKYRGLYNIYLKSIGAARKKAPTTRLDYAIEYGDRMQEPGFYFMDSPGNDLESIAGQVAAGCNLIIFATGNGSITNFPFVPTIKVVTTTERFRLLINEMDVNSGTYLDGVAIEELGKQSFDLTVQVISGQPTAGERAGHAQVQIWRNWQQNNVKQLNEHVSKPKPRGIPISIKTSDRSSPIQFQMFRHADGVSRSDQVALIMPTSLCAGQVASMITKELNNKELTTSNNRLTRFVTMPHTEGCGNSGAGFEEMYSRTMVSYITHPLVKHCLLLEHGCEKTHNGYMREQIQLSGGHPDRLGYASIQLDGGIDQVSAKVQKWFIDQLSDSEQTEMTTVGLEALRIGILIDGHHSPETYEQLASLTRMIVGAGGLIVVPETADSHATNFTSLIADTTQVRPTLAYGEQARINGFHIMETPTTHWVETMTGLAATGVELIIVLVQRPMQTHPLVPVLQLTTIPALGENPSQDLDLILTGNPNQWPELILTRCKEVIEHTYTPRLFEQGNIDFQFTRGLFGISL